MFCTNGVLLRMLTRGDGLSDITHVRLRSECPWAQRSQAAVLLTSAACAGWLVPAVIEMIKKPAITAELWSQPSRKMGP